VSDLPITPETKVAHLLEAYPDLEAVLIELAPVFERLRNPILRRTVARLTSLEGAAGIAGLDVRTLVRRPPGTSAAPRPAWIGDREPTATLDADRLLEESETPLPHVLAAARALAPDGLLRVTVSFRPLPMVEALRHQGLRTHLETMADGRIALYVASGR